MWVATWNIAGIRARLGTLLTWLKTYSPDIVCLQEIKSVANNFPFTELEDLGYHIALNSQPQFNGVAVLSKRQPAKINLGFGMPEMDEQARFIEIMLHESSGTVRVACLYAPNGNPLNSNKYEYKINWLNGFYKWLGTAYTIDDVMILAGDFNIIPTAEDAKNIKQWSDDALYSLAARQSLNKIKKLGFIDAASLCSLTPGYSFWDFQKGAWQKNNGIRIDFLLLSPRAADTLVTTQAQKHVRAWEKPSDHIPIMAELAI